MAINDYLIGTNFIFKSSKYMVQAIYMAMPNFLLKTIDK